MCQQLGFVMADKPFGGIVLRGESDVPIITAAFYTHPLPLEYDTHSLTHPPTLSSFPWSSSLCLSLCLPLFLSLSLSPRPFSLPRSRICLMSEHQHMRSS